MSGQLQEMEIRDLSCDVFQVFQHATPLLSAGSAEKFNTMVIGWGGLGTLWGKAVCTVYVRPQRYTYEFMERENAFSVSVLPPECRVALRVCGSDSGRDVDQVKKCGLTPAFSALDLRPEKFTDQSLDGRWYPEHDYHRMYAGEVVQVLKK